MTEQTSTVNPFAGAEVISAYTRAEAIEDGMLIDVSEMAQEVGFKWPVAVTHTVKGRVLEVPDCPEAAGESVEGRLWDVLWMASRAICQHTRQKPGDPVEVLPFEVLATDKAGKKTAHKLLAHAGPGDDGEPVITIMFPEDN